MSNAKQPIRAQLEKKVWSKTHKDFRAIYAGVQCVMIMGIKGSTLCAISNLTDEQIASRLGLK